MDALGSRQNRGTFLSLEQRAFGIEVHGEGQNGIPSTPDRVGQRGSLEIRSTYIPYGLWDRTFEDGTGVGARVQRPSEELLGALGYMSLLTNQPLHPLRM